MPSTESGVTVITGASSGIGRSLALDLARRGVPLALVARRQAELDETAAQVRAAGGTAIVKTCDVTDPAQVLAAFHDIERQAGSIARVVANAGGGHRVSGHELKAEDLQSMFALNVLGTMHCIEAVLPGMLARGSGHLVLMGSLAGVRGLPRAAGYSAAKAAVARLGESLRIDLGPKGIDVTVLVPGFVATKVRRKPRRLEVPLPVATRRMGDAIMARRTSYRFPWTINVLFAVAAMIPERLADRLLRRLAK